MHFSDPLTSTVADELARCGVTDVVASPGLHSGVLAHAVHQCPGMRLHVRIDERSAAFLALGLARASGRPAAVVCTSGTAAANLHPAVLEARHSRVPLVVITTDRLPALRGTGANQATDQVRLYGTATPHYTELNTEPPTTATVRYWRSAVSRAVGSCAHGRVHLNIGLHEPYDAPAPLRGRGGPPGVGAPTGGTLDPGPACSGAAAHAGRGRPRGDRRRRRRERSARRCHLRRAGRMAVARRAAERCALRCQRHPDVRRPAQPSGVPEGGRAGDGDHHGSARRPPRGSRLPRSGPRPSRRRSVR